MGSAPDVNVAMLGQFAYKTDTHTISGLIGGLSQSYRGRIVDKLGNKSPWTNWVTATTDISVDKILDIVQGKINGSSLDVALTTKIDKIGTIEGNLATETQQRIDAIIETKQKADAAQTAATNAATLAGNKGEVIYQWQTPAAARQLPQNLWIDTTGGKNTPKRWDGSAWVAVTDKAAIDAQVAAAEALSKANAATQNIATILNEQQLIKDDLGVQYETLQGVIADYQPEYFDKTKYFSSQSQNWTYAKTVARDNYATSERITNLQSEVGSSSAQLRQELTTVATATTATASKVETLQTTVNGNTASIQTYNVVINGLRAQSSLVLDVNGYVVGTGTYNDGKTGTFAIRADEFYIGSPNGSKELGFVHYETAQNINGVTIPIGTYLRNAYIANGAITLAKIDTATITSLSALSATIGHFKSAPTGARLEIKDSLLSVYDANNVLRVRLGIW